VGAVAAVLSDHQTPAQGVKRRDGICVTESRTVGSERPREHVRVACCLRSLDEAIRGIHRLLTGTGRGKGDNQKCPDGDVGVTAACELGAAAAKTLCARRSRVWSNSSKWTVRGERVCR
jgi:hypothetical protein